tara:strand:- start:1014 stop:1313 length:300 start_codon:yes stop_codon:yes gene_type:complete
MSAALFLFNKVIDLFVIGVILGAVFSWLIAFNIVNINNRFVYTLVDFLNRLTEPFLRPIRRFLPDLGGVDISPIILILLLYTIQIFVNDKYRTFILNLG